MGVTRHGASWQGKYQAIEQSERYGWDRAEGYWSEHVWEGPIERIEQLEADLQNFGGPESYRCDPIRGQLYRLTARFGKVDGIPGGDDYEERWELVPNYVEKDLRTFEDFADDAEDMEEIDKEIDKGKASDMSLSGDPDKYRDLRLLGVESYLVHQPVVRRVRVCSSASTVSASMTGILAVGSSPPVPSSAKFSLPAGMDWLKMPPHVVTLGSGKVQLTEEWWGADEWSNKLYGGTGSP